MDQEALLKALLQEARKDVFCGWGRVIITEFLHAHPETSKNELLMILKEVRKRYEANAIGNVIRIRLCDYRNPNRIVYKL